MDFYYEELLKPGFFHELVNIKEVFSSKKEGKLTAKQKKLYYNRLYTIYSSKFYIDLGLDFLKETGYVPSFKRLENRIKIKKRNGHWITTSSQRIKYIPNGTIANVIRVLTILPPPLSSLSASLSSPKIYSIPTDIHRIILSFLILDWDDEW